MLKAIVAYWGSSFQIMNFLCLVGLCNVVILITAF